VFANEQYGDGESMGESNWKSDDANLARAAREYVWFSLALLFVTLVSVGSHT
jgi:hypothetical protein